MESLFYHNYKESKGSFKKTLSHKSTRQALTLHPIKDPQQQYKMQNYFHSIHMEDLCEKERYLLREITGIEQNLGILKPPVDQYKHGMMPSLTKYIPKTRDNVLTWGFLSKSVVSMGITISNSGINKQLKHVLKDNIEQVLQIMNVNAGHNVEHIDFKDLVYGYRRVSSISGVDNALNLLLTYSNHTSSQITMPMWRRVYLQQSFGAVEVIEDSARVSKSITKHESDPPFTLSHPGNANSSAIIHVILPLAGKVTIFERFMANYEEVCLKTKEATYLHVVVFNNNTDSTSATKLISIVEQYQKRYNSTGIEVLYSERPFERGKARDMGQVNLNRDSLLFFIDVDVLFDRKVLQRIRLNTVKHAQVYYPILFSQYDPILLCSNADTCNIQWNNFSSDFGFWRTFGYGMVSVYKQDLMNVGGWDTTIKGWGKEDVNLYLKFKKSNLTIHRSVDPGLVHIFHEKTCDVKLEKTQYKMCVGSKASCVGSQRQLSSIIFGVPEILNITSENIL